MSNPPGISINIPDEVRALIHSDKRPTAEIAHEFGKVAEALILREFGEDNGDGR